MAIEIVDFPIKNGDFPWQNVSSPEGIFSLHVHVSFLVEPAETDLAQAVFAASAAVSELPKASPVGGA